MGDKRVTFTVPGEPQDKGRPRACVRGEKAATYTPPQKTASYEGLIAVSAQSAMGGRPPFAGACAVDMDIKMSVPLSWSGKKRAQALSGLLYPTKRSDVDNIGKAIFDGMNDVVWTDDVQAVYVVVRKEYAETPGVLVNVSELSSGADS